MATNTSRTRERNNNWRGGRSIASNGYIIVRVGTDHHLSDVRGYAYEHRVVAEQKIGRQLDPGEIVHHINGNKQDNRPENLEVVANNAEHFVRHRSGHGKRLRMPDEPNPLVSCACGCGEKFSRFDDGNRPRKFVAGHNPQSSPTMDAILSALTYGQLNRPQIAKRTGIPIRAVAACLSKLKRAGLVNNRERGVWYLVRHPKMERSHG